MNSNLPYYDSYIIISNNNKHNDIFHKKTIFKTLTNEHILKILFLQKIKIKSNNFTRVIIFLDDIELDELNLHPKLYKLCKYGSESFGIFFKNTSDIQKNIENIKKYADFIDNYKKK